MAAKNKTSRFWKYCEVCGEKMPSYALRDHMIDHHPQIMRDRGELGRYFDKRGMKVMGPGVLLLMLLGICLIFLTDISGIVLVIVIAVAVAILATIYFLCVQMHS
jgi:Flp pilus assembly protein TadB